MYLRGGRAGLSINLDGGMVCGSFAAISASRTLILRRHAIKEVRMAGDSGRERQWRKRINADTSALWPLVRRVC